METRYNVKYNVNWVQDSSYLENLSRLQSTNSFPDVIQFNDTGDPTFTRAVEAGQIWDLTPYLKIGSGTYPNLDKLIPNAWMNSKYQGKNYVIPTSRGQYDSGIMVRGDVLKKYGLSLPKSIADFEAYFDACVKENIIPVPIWIQKNVGNFQPAFGPGSMIPVYNADKTGVLPQQLTESYALTVEWFASLYKKGYLPQEFALIDSAQTENFLVTGKGGSYFKNGWHRYRLNDEIHKVLPTAEIVPVFYYSGPGGTRVWYDKGFYGGIAINKKVPEAKMLKIIEFFNATAAPESVNYFQYGIPGIHHNVVDGFPKFTDQGAREINNSTYIPFILATTTYIKIDSPLAPPAYNLETREMVKVIDAEAAKLGVAPFNIFEIIGSKSFSAFWALNQDEFQSNVVDVITGKKTVAQFRTYQQQLLARPEVQAAAREYKESYDSFGLVNWKPAN
ncbi:hypothetical protein AGMMS49587_14760 [Spirochaetia bacterium]|nr:hypothetical protein AGMMS49587_14760 [Spirochaetia bacterium]